MHIDVVSEARSQNGEQMTEPHSCHWSASAEQVSKRLLGVLKQLKNRYRPKGSNCLSTPPEKRACGRLAKPATGKPHRMRGPG